MTDYYIDNNNGDDGNTGLDANHSWKNISKIGNLTSVQLPAGSNIYLAKGSIWEIQDTRDAWKQVLVNNFVNGTSNSPITITSYGTGAIPKISYHMYPLNDWWIWDATVSAWYFELTWDYWGRGFLGVKAGGEYAANVGNYLKISPSTNINTIVGTNDITSDTLRWLVPSVNTKRLYFAGAGLSVSNNPYQQFGANGVVIYCGAIFVSTGMVHTVFDGIEFDSGGALFYTLPAGTLNIPGLTIKNCVADGGLFLQNGLANTDSIIGVDIYNNTIKNTVRSGIAMNITATGSIHDNTFSNGNLCDSSGGFVYLQLAKNTAASPPSPFKVHDNYAEYAKNGIGERTFDGCCYYLDIGDNGTIVTNNIAAYSFKGFQCNSGRKSYFIANIAYKCCKFGTFTDADMAGASDYTIVNNTWISSQTQTTYRCGATEGALNPGANAVIQLYNNLATVTSIKVYNNQFIAKGTGWSDFTPIKAYKDTHYASGAPSFLDIKTNTFYGINSQWLKSTDLTDIDRSSLYSGQAISGNGNITFNGSLPSGISDANCLMAGTDLYIDNVTDINNRSFMSPPSIGAFEAIALFRDF